ncbi:MAG: alpha/beta hydrolase [Gordonia sp. (in: high G+C Gram-positive bacteria)]|uniref:alpha/beta hydrolase n=1 Tax=Gordonia sp. (in: high G+C Gram-positive bacteria) TaxID=84139 RepID=UPI0039E72AE2
MQSHGTRAALLARLLLLPLTAVLAAGCAVGPNAGPAVVRGGGSKGTPGSASKKAAPVPAIGGIRTDLDWRDCPSAMAARYGATPDKQLRIKCTTLRNGANPSVSGGQSVSVPLVSVRLPSTPADAAPLVAVTGTDLPAGQLALALADGPAGKALLAKHPVVAIEQRGLADVDCLTRADRTVIADYGLVGTGTDAKTRVNKLAAAARSAADSCTDTLDDNALAFSYALAATDIEALRTKWGVDRLAVLGVGTGSEVALAFAAQYPDRVGRLVLDTPTPYGGPTKQRATARVRGVQQALETFTRRCTTDPACRGKEADPSALLQSVITKARAGTLKDVNDAQLLDAVTIEVGLATDPARLRALVAALAAADGGNTGELATLVRRTAALQTSDGMLVSRCNNASGTVGLNEIEGLLGEWGKQYPLVGTTQAIGLARCTGWGTANPASAPNSYAVPPLVFASGADPVNGSDPASLNKVFADGSTAPTTVSWDGVGYSVLSHSDCAAGIVNDYLDADGLTGDRTRACPAT